MATRAELRSAVRAALGDPSVSPLWDDAAINEALAEAVRIYGTALPKQATSSLSIVAGTTTYATPAACVSVIELTDDDGNAVPTRAAVPAVNGSHPRQTETQSWEWFAGSIWLTHAPTANATWSLRYLSSRELIADDVTAQPIEPNHEPIVIQHACARLWGARAADDAKRGGKNNLAARQHQYAAEQAERMTAAAKRRPRQR